MFRKIFGMMAVLGLVVFWSGCSRTPEISGDPKQRLTDYVTKSFAVKQFQDREQLLSYMTGDVKRRLESWSEDQFRDAFLNSKRTLSKITIREVKPISDDETQITYELIYNEIKKEVDGQMIEAKVTNKKLCQMLRAEHGRWYISDVKNIKELIEFNNSLSLP